MGCRHCQVQLLCLIEHFLTRKLKADDFFI